MKLVKTAIKRPVGVIMLVITTLILGMISLKDLAIDLFPDMDLPIAVVATTYEGAAPEEVEELITKPIENVLSGLDGLDTIQSVSQPNTSLVVLMFDFGTNIESTLNEIRESLDRIEGFLPEEAGTPRAMRIDPTATPVLWVSLSGDMPLDKLQSIATNNIQPKIERVEGVASVNTEGTKDREIQVELDQKSLQAHGITPQQVIQALAVDNRSISAGTVIRGNQELQLRIDGKYTSVRDIENTRIQLPQGGSVQVKDIATVNDTFKEQSMFTRVNGKDALVFSIMKQSDANTVSVSDGVLEAIEKMEKELADQGLELKVVIDSAEFIRDSIDMVYNNIMIGGLLAFVILLLFFGNIRSALVIGISMPVAIIATFTLMYFTGQTLNILSLGGLALGVGMMVDNSIVILENIFYKREKGLGLKQAALEGGSELAAAIIASTLTTAVVFLPIVFTKGLAAELFTPLALTVSFSLFMSLLTALTIVPMLSSRMLGNVKVNLDNHSTRGFFNRFLQNLRNIYGIFLEKCLRNRKKVIAIIFAVLIGSFALVPVIGYEFMPEADDGYVMVSVEMQTGIDVSETEKVAQEIFDRLEENYKDEIDIMYASIGGQSGFQQTVNSHIAQFYISLVPSTERDITTKQFIKKADELISDIPGADITVTGMDMTMGGTPIVIEISGDDLDVLNDLSQQVVWLLEGIEGTANVESSASEGIPEVQVVVDRDLASQYGLSYQQVMEQVRLGFSGQIATFYRENGNEYNVKVSLPKEERTTIRDLETMVIRNHQGMNIPLTAIAELKQVQGPAEINHQDKIRQVNVTSDIRDRDLGSVSRDIEKKLQELNLPDGYSVSLGGEIEQMEDTFEDLVLVFILSVFLVYMVMAVQFESFTHPFVIMFSVPTMFIGAIIGLAISRIAFSIPAFIGLIMLAGIVVNNGIVLVEYIRILREKGYDRIEAIIESGKSRLRPILMTTLTTVFALLPIVFGIGEGTETQQPMAIVVCFGLLSSTFFTLVLVPVMYLVIDNMTEKFKNMFKKKSNTFDEIESVD